MVAGQVGVACCDPVDQASFDQEVEHPIDRNRSRPALAAETLDDVVSAERHFGMSKLGEDSPPQRRENGTPHAANILGVPDQDVRIVRMLMIVSFIHCSDTHPIFDEPDRYNVTTGP